MFSSSHCISNTGESSCSVDTGTVDKGRLRSLHPVHCISNTGESSCSVDTGTVDKGHLRSLHPVTVSLTQASHPVL